MIDPDTSLSLSDKEKRLLDKTPDVDRETKLQALQDEYALITAASDPHHPESLRRACIALEIAGLQLDFDHKLKAWEYAQPTVEVFLAHKKFEDAALAFQYVYLADQEDALPAIGQAAWLSVTFPVDPHLTANILTHIIDETPDNSDGAAVAAATADYVVDMRSDGPKRESLRQFTGANLARVAKRHGNVQSQTEFELWIERLELDVPDKFLVRLRNIIDVLVQTDWWFDRDALQKLIPE